MAVELECAQRMGHTFDRIALAVGPVVSRIDMPPVAGAMMRLVSDAVHHRISKLHVLVLHVDLGAKDSRALFVLAVTHIAKKFKVFVNGP